MQDQGSLTIVGMGIQIIRHMTVEALQHVRDADRLLYLVATDLHARWLHMQNDAAESLESSLLDGRPRVEAYREMAERLLAPVRDGHRVCACFYGHPGVFVSAAHEALRLARAEGLQAVMLPAVSAEDCLFADLSLDPAAHGCQSFEATDFLLCRRRFDERSLLVLWQVGVIGEMSSREGGYSSAGLTMLRDRLLEVYPPSHEVIVYEAAPHPSLPTRRDRVALSVLESATVSAVSTLVVPILEPAGADLALAEQLQRLVADT